MAGWAPRCNFEHVCRECAFHFAERGYDKCSRRVSLVTGETSPGECMTARSRDGYCGPEGRHHVSKEVIAKPGKVVKIKERV